VKRRLLILALLLAPPALLAARWAASDDAPPAPRKAPDFTLKDPRDDRAVSLSDFKDKKAVVVVFLGTECPVNNAFVPVLVKLHEEYSAKGVQFIGVNANRQDTPPRVAEHARKFGVPFPVLKDPGNAVADRFGAERTPEAFVLDGERAVVYRGRIDDQFGVGYSRPGKPTRRDLAEALDEVLAGKPVSRPTTKVSGCPISRVAEEKAGGGVTYAREVSRILQKNCVECHRAGQIGPMPLTAYDDAAAWAEGIREAVTDGRMPPWNADPRFGEWANARVLSKEDRETLLSWIDAGAPRGDDKDLPPPREFPEGWAIGKPDVVFTMPRPFQVPAEAPRGGVPYKYFSVQTDFGEDRWVERAEVHPGAPAVVHHIVVFIVPKGETFDPEGPGNVLCGVAPGEPPGVLPPGLAKKVPAGARLVFQMHYTPNGKAVADQSSVGLVFAKAPPEHRVLTKPVLNNAFVFQFDKIPAGAENYEITAEYTFPQDAHLLNFMPHMHLRGKDFTYELLRPGGKAETLLSVPRYDFNWQTLYRGARPIAAPKGSTLRCVAHFDNSAKNPSNPDPKADVYWGDQTWEEMMIGWIDYYLDDEAP
jgi:peroxiredoxin/mono/diheme cytochrome c family protein